MCVPVAPVAPVTPVAQQEGIAIAKVKGKYKGRPVKYHEHAKNAQDRLIYGEIVRMLNNNEFVIDIRKRTGVTRMTIYSIKKRISI